MKAIMKYPGSKWSIANWIIDFFPKHHSYLEPFFGSGDEYYIDTGWESGADEDIIAWMPLSEPYRKGT